MLFNQKIVYNTETRIFAKKKHNATRYNLFLNKIFPIQIWKLTYYSNYRGFSLNIFLTFQNIIRYNVILING